MARSNSYKIRRVTKNDVVEACSLAVPLWIANKIPDNVKFQVEWTEEGILYRPLGTDESTSEAPAWVNELGGGDA